MLPPLGALRGPTPSAETTLLLSASICRVRTWLKARYSRTAAGRREGLGGKARGAESSCELDLAIRLDLSNHGETPGQTMYS